MNFQSEDGFNESQECDGKCRSSTIVDHDAILFQKEVDICVELALASFSHENQDIATALNIFFDGIKLRK